VFSFTLYGSNPKYTFGMIENVKLINEKFSEWHIYIYYNNVPIHILSQLTSLKNVMLIQTEFYDIRARLERYYAIDNDDVDVMVVRDADSRIHTRDEWCIREFIKSDKSIHIVRDHPHHGWKMLSGLWGIKQGCLPFKIRDSIITYFQTHPITWCIDMEYLSDTIYPMLAKSSIVHGLFSFSKDETNVTIPFPIVDYDFCGQVIDYSSDGSMFKVYKDI